MIFDELKVKKSKSAKVSSDHEFFRRIFVTNELCIRHQYYHILCEKMHFIVLLAALDG